VSVAELITRAKREGLAFSIEGDKIRCRLPKPAHIRIKPLVDEIRQRRDEVIAALKLEAHKDFPGSHHPKTLTCDIEAGEIVAVKIASTVLSADIWLAFSDDFKPGEGEPLAVFYADEIPILDEKTPEQLREIHKAKLAFGPGARVRK